MNNSITPLFITFAILVFFNLSRLFCNTYCLRISLYQTILYDNFHHYQLGIVLFVLAFFFLRGRRKLRDFLISLGIGMVIDESMYLLPPLGFSNFTHNRIEGTIFEFVIFFVYAFLHLLFERKSNYR